MAEQNTLPDSSVFAQMETDNLYKEVEPEANEIVFGQKNVPDRPLTTKEISKRKKTILKLVDQKLKFRLIELMSQQVASEHTKETATTIPSVAQTINNSHSYTSYESQPNWYPYSGVQNAEGNWRQHCQPEWQPPNYPPLYGTVVDTSWNNNFCHQPNFQGNIQYSNQDLDTNQSFVCKAKQNPNLISPVVDATKMSNAIYRNNKTSTKTSVDVQEQPNETVSVSASRSSLISVRTENV